MSTETQTPGRDAFIHERKRGYAQGQKMLLSQLGASSPEEAAAAMAAYKRSKEGGGTHAQATQAADAAAKRVDPTSTGVDADALKQLLAEQNKVLDERLKPVTEFMTSFQQKEAERVKAEAEAKAAREAEAASEAERVATEKALKAERRTLKRIAKAEGFDDSDPENFEELEALYSARCAKLSDEEAEKLFGENADDEDRETWVRETIRKIKPRSTHLFKKADGGEGGQTAPAKTEAATTSRASGSAATQAAATPATQKRALNMADPRWSRDQIRQYNANPAEFRRKFQEGLIDYANAKK